MSMSKHLTEKIILHGWRVSMYTGKLHSYLCYKQLPSSFAFQSMGALQLLYFMPRRVGASVMPVLQLPPYTTSTSSRSVFLQDTHDIILSLEKMFPLNPVLPGPDSSSHSASESNSGTVLGAADCVSDNQTGEKRFFAYLLAGWFDECWVPTAMHYRWNFPESVKFFRAEAKKQLLGDTLARVTPSFIAEPLIDNVVRTLTSYLPSVGVRREQGVKIEKWTERCLSLLETHFSRYDFLLGTATPTIADFALTGPLIAHLCRDPYPLHNLIHHYPFVMEFATRMSGKSWTNEYAPNELPDNKNKRPTSKGIPETLIPIIKTIFSEFVPLVKLTQAEILKLTTHPKFSIYGDNRGLPRALPEISFPILEGKESFSKAALPFNVWKFQQATKEFQRLPGSNQTTILNWLHSNGIYDTNVLTDTQFPELQRTALRVKF